MLLPGNKPASGWNAIFYGRGAGKGEGTCVKLRKLVGKAGVIRFWHLAI